MPTGLHVTPVHRMWIDKMKLWKTVLAVWICISTSLTYASDGNEFSGCGEYEVNGVIAKQGKLRVLKIKGVNGEITMDLDEDLEEVSQIFMDKAVIVNGKILSPLEKNRGLLQSTKTAKEIAEMRTKDKPFSARFDRNDIRERTPDPLHPEWEAGFKLVNKLPCRKKK